MKVKQTIVSGILLFLTVAFGVCSVGCDSYAAETVVEEGVRDRLGEGSGLPSLGVGRYTIAQIQNEEAKATICIDPGHGFDDVGASSKYIPDQEE
jgi:N-acetylmuramoyl-L-alanine amidase